MMLSERIYEDLVVAQKSGDHFRVDTLRLVIAEIKNRVIEKRDPTRQGTLTDEEVITVLQKEAKKRRESVEVYTKGNRHDLARKEGNELTIISGYLPEMMSREEIKSAVSRIAKKSGGDFKAVMKIAAAELKGKADGKLVSEVVKEVVG